MPMQYSTESDSKRIAAISLYKPKYSASTSKKRGRNISAYHVVFLMLYMYQAYWCYSTSGEPYHKFLLKAEREGFQVMEGTTKMRAELEYALQDINDPDRPKDKIGWFDWVDMDIEEHAERKKREKEQTVLDSLPKSMRVPKRHMPEFTPMLIWGIFVTVHLLIVLMQHWSVGFRVWVNFREVNVTTLEIPENLLDLDHYLDDDEEEEDGAANSGGGGSKGSGGDPSVPKKKKTLGEIVYERAMNKPIPSHLPTHARIQPSSGRDILVPLLYLPTLGLTFEYHRRRYTYNQASEEWTKIRCQTSMPTTFFADWEGFTNPAQITASDIRFGKNEFNVRQPTFKEMYKAQLLSPFTVFQIFCVVLWMLDDYWQYSFFTLFMILTFEATVVFSRIKSLGALKGMGNKPRNVMVYRMNEWINVESCDLLPGDVMSLTRVKTDSKKKNDDNNAKDSNGSEKKKKQTLASTLSSREIEDGDIVPVDLLLLRGTAVVNEASLTGESIPQMKEGMNEFLEGEDLNMKNQHKTHILYAGTKMLQCKGVDVVEAEELSSDEDEANGDESGANDEVHDKLYGSIPKPPDGGSLCFVLRTGFSSAQGKLVRMIEGSQEKVKGHERETGLLLLLLFFFAVASSGYVLHHGLQNENRSQYELLLHCILIITSVIPPELPMQMAMAVNNSLMTLMKMQVFCTEPYRVPIAGKLDACLFDKTGTLTTDELVAVGVLEAKALEKNTSSNTSDLLNLTPMTKVVNEAALVLGGCHSLVLIEGEITGDPLENASLSAMRWGLDKGSGYAVPLVATEKKQAGKSITVDGASGQISSIEVLSRHHFSSKLQRMSCVVRDVKQKRAYAVAKGSPEAIGKLLVNKPNHYDECAKGLAKRGYRVIAMGYKRLSSEEIELAKDARSACEENIIFAGFIAFTCRVRKDTKMVLHKLMEGGMSVTMVTGDALLTAAHVAKEVGICYSEGDDDEPEVMAEKDEELRKLLRKKLKETADEEKIAKTPKSILILEQDKFGSMFWQSYDDESRVQDYVAADVPELATKFELATTGKNLTAAFEFDAGTTRILGSFKIFARMTPDAKETVIECLHSIGALCLMCGDGANDVGALKQADVGVALLSGFGDLNVDKGEDGNKKDDKKGCSNAPIPNAIMTQDQITALKAMPVAIIKAKIRQLGVEPNKYPDLVEKDDLVKLYQIKAREKAVQMHDKKNAMAKMNMSKAERKAEQMKAMEEKQKKVALRVAELEAQGVQWAQFKACKELMANELAESKKKKGDLAKVRGVEGQAAALATQFEDLELDDIPMVKLGDASIAAPFTSKMPSIKSCVDIIRQGRCTLVTTMQMYQILALNCLISSYSLSVLYLDGVKYGDVQMTAMGMLGSVSYMSVSRSKPLDKLSPVKPLGSIFHPSMFLSLLGQFSVHLVVMMVAVREAKKFIPTDIPVDLDGQFKPGILNSVVFLVNNVQSVTVFVVNLQGRPFMTGLTENRPLLWSLIATFILTFMFASESVPGLNKYFQLVPFPNDDFRDFILKILVADVIGTFCFDRLMKFIFCPEILFASMRGTTSADMMKVARTIGTILAIMYMFLGNDEQWEEMLREEGREGEFDLDIGTEDIIETVDSTGLLNSTIGTDEF